MYKLKTEIMNGTVVGHIFTKVNGDKTISSFIADPANTDYANFKSEILAGAQLQDADGNVMTAKAAKAFVKELP